MFSFLKFYMVFTKSFIAFILSLVGIQYSQPNFFHLLTQALTPKSGTLVFFIISGMIDFLIIAFVVGGIKAFWEKRQLDKLKKKFEDNVNGTHLLTVNEVLELKASERKTTWVTLNQPGVYLLLNEKNKTYYVGQATRMIDRIRQHFNGKGNPDVYADYKYGTEFKIRCIPFQNSGYDTLNDLEREAIKAYEGYTKGYNRNRGLKA